MATDIMGLLTGVSKQGISPLSKQGVNPMLSQLTPAQQRMEFGRQSAQGLQRAIGGMFGGGVPIQEQIQAGLINKQLKEQEVINKTDYTNVESLKNLVGVLQSRGESSKAMTVMRRIEQLEAQETLKQTLLKVAKAQGKQDIMDMINDGADLNVVSRLLLTQSTKPSAPATLSTVEKDNYFDILKQIIEKYDINENELPKVVSDEGVLYGRNLKSKKDLTSFFMQVEELRRQNKDLSVEQAILQLAGLSSLANITPEVSSDAGTMNNSTDEFSNLKTSGSGLKSTGKI